MLGEYHETGEWTDIAASGHVCQTLTKLADGEKIVPSRGGPLFCIRIIVNKRSPARTRLRWYRDPHFPPDGPPRPHDVAVLRRYVSGAAPLFEGDQPGLHVQR